MNTLIINGRKLGECSRPRERGYGSFAYVFLMKQNYYITVEKNDILDYWVEHEIIKSKGYDNYNYVFELRQM